jgi:hypothetical protein
MFESNKYSVWYFNIINNAKTRNWTKKNSNIYVENHHIVPKSFGGSDDESNLVLLTAKEHYICHLLLIRFTSGDFKSKMLFALKCMSNRSHKNMYRYSGNSILYEKHRIQCIYLLKSKPGPNLGKQFSSLTRKKMSKARLGIEFSNEQKEKMSTSQKNRYKLSGKGYCCIKCNRNFPGSNPTKHFNFCYGLP